MKLKNYLWGICYGLVLMAFTGYILLDTFVITRVYSTVETEESQVIGSSTVVESTESSEPDNAAITATESASAELTITENSYDDGNISVCITEYREYDTSIYVASVQLSSPDYLKTALAENAYGKNVTAKTSEIAESNDAILAINGDYYGAQEKGYVLRNGVLYRDTVSAEQEDLVIYSDGSFSVITENNVTAQTLLDDGAQQILSFGPALVANAQIAVTEDEEVGKAKTSNPRTAIGIMDELNYVFVVSDGRTEESAGLTLYELAEFMQRLGVTTAYNLDGGGSSTMYFRGEVVNNPTSNGKRIKERSVSDIVYIGY